VGVPLLAACSGSSGQTASDPGSQGSGAGSGHPSGQKLTATSDIEVGGGKIFADQEVVVTQPTSGEFKCFTAICTHQGCPVSDVSDGTINCNCHGSQFSIENGEVKQGPATFPLSEVPITVGGSEITFA
jgi:Rieske Fe-S protein